MKETATVDADDPEQGQETPSKPSFDLVPSLKGRQRRKNPRYSDYDTRDTNAHERQSDEEKSATKKLGKEVTPQKTPAKRGRPKKVPQPSVDEKAASQVSNGEMSTKKTPAAKRPPSNKTPAKTNINNTSPGPGESVENGTPKPKRKYVRKQVVKAEPVAREKSPEVPEEAEPGGRRRRSAAKMAMKFLHAMAQEEISHSAEDPQANSDSIPKTAEPASCNISSQGGKGRRGRKRKYSDSDGADDQDFVPDVEEEEVDNEEEEEEVEDDYDDDDVEETDWDSNYKRSYSSSASGTKLEKKLASNMMKTIWEAFNTYKEFRKVHHSSLLFSEWIPSSSAWTPVPQSEVEAYLPQERRSAAFKVSREGCKEEACLQRLSRFEAVPPHQDYWDMHLNAGGPVWAMEWCPTPDGAVVSQYLAVACHRNMDDQHYLHKNYSGPSLVQLWYLGTLEYNSRPTSQPGLAYGLVLDKGCIWNLKWCPSGVWEMPSTRKQAPFLPRLGLLAVATSTAVVTMYSLPHPEALNISQNLPDSGGSGQRGSIYKPDPVLRLKLGSLKSLRLDQSGQVLSMDWLPVQPHDVIAVGFYDGIVGLWDLNTKSALLRVQGSHDSLTLLPFKCFLAHDHAVRALAFCPANRNLLVTAGEDRLLKTWDLRRLYGPITVQKRSVPNEIYWPMNSAGLLWAQESAYAATFSQGVHYFDHKMRSYFAVPRMITTWSISYSDWLNSLVTSDVLGEVIFATLPSNISTFQAIKRPVERRFPVYFTTLEPHEDTGEEQDEPVDAGCEEEEEEAEGGSGGKVNVPTRQLETYKEAERKFYLHHTDSNMLLGTSGRLWKQMQASELKSKINMDHMPLAALHKVRLNPNMTCHTWLASAGQAGLVRLNCLRIINNPDIHATIRKTRAQFEARHPPTKDAPA
ncbi:general transcription factor 3C polypeptide 2 [Dunckerocampus dactyliophorus]|uniref:general transcription factor 3C polypeptide 2 n=1 Tax=Dunckerocampus dactyliophorus TaxID=161453 RepID=UPI00240760DE|nr:general transcription factor 3C polypeptide 2 [Dunckerocampus dactyliophorus]XP_054618121.1 general transcription factor 3C polypeptide 2 [Dunckerocampus dactyliophorus]XP_054618122.1 general transcription factor 3C polypeptide 2 [Dunckerocampus dactyliophorus]XP_054618124.1 general transcription factor 3C polypeptide 2 [Dunckerocampus dactyliophorus]XP_054618125.1 general transcription factor 3C polypeptide 2 [Dunckerocampus dactyliophorus]XP_054618126.1 general transcription factor 3C pol